ncbi:hypothetical protein NK6_5505 [Bradyrhizobium diazoefficiens]|uniref:Uncharacterized protein n=1 Tax=Bradyrhizobium diazoefficiens TaxID=1355477 RepID=A0A0E4BS85_9BRAD|nr:hypothetical protein NK6_5505 [Bradyrhizobium diazoefficiens]
MPIEAAGGVVCANTGAMIRHTRLAATVADGNFIEFSRSVPDR